MELLKLANLCEYLNAFWPTKLKCGATCVPSNGFHQMAASLALPPIMERKLTM